MESGKSKLGLLLILVLILMASGSARVYIPQDVNQNYPEIAFNDKGSSKAQWDALGQSESYEIRSLTHIGPFGDYDGDGSLRIPIRATSGTPYVKANKRTSTDYFGLDDENGNDKPKSGKILSAGLIDDDLKTDLLFIDQNGELAYIDSDSYGSFSQSAGGVIGTGDVDRDGYEEYAFIGTSTNLKYFNYEEGDSDPDTQSFGSASVNSKISASTLLHLGDGDGYVEVAYQTGSSYLKAKDTKNSETGRLDDGLGNIKGYSIGTLWLEDGDGRPEMAVAGNSNEMYLCSYDDNNGDCQQTGKDNGFGIIKKKTKGTRSYIPPFVKEPKLNKTPVTQGESVKVVFNATDWEGYTDIVNKTAEVKFTSTSGASYIVDANEFTKRSAVPGSSKAGGFVPEDGKTKAFKATFNMPDDADTTQDWNVSVQVKDEKMTGTKNWTTFQVEKAVVEKNVSESLSVGRKDTSRQTSLGKSQLTGLSFASAGLTESFTNRLLTESLGFSSGKDRKQTLDKNVVTDMALSRSGSNFKSSFSVLPSSIVTGSTVSDIYSTAVKLNPVFGLSDSSSGTAIFDGSVTETFGLDISQGKGIVQRTLELILRVSSDEGRSTDVDRLSQTGLDVGSSTPTGLALARSFNSGFTFGPQIQFQQNILRLFGLDVGLESRQFRDQSLQRSENNTITGSFSSSRSVSFGRLLSETFSQSPGFSRSDSSFFRDSSQGISASGSFEGLSGAFLFYSFGVGDTTERTSAGFTRMLFSDLIAGNSASTDSSFFRGSNQSLIAQNGLSSTGMFFGSATQPLSIGQSFVGSPDIFRSFTETLLVEEGQSSEAFFGRTEAQGIDSSGRFSRSNSVWRLLGTGISTTQTFQAFDGVIVLLDQMIGVDGQESDVMESSRDQETSIDASADISSDQLVYRSLSQSFVASAGPPFLDIEFIDGLVNDVACRIFGQGSGFCETGEGQGNQDDGNGGSDSGGGPGGGSIGDVGTGDNSNDVGGDNESTGVQEDEIVSEAEENVTSEVREVNATLRPSGTEDNVEKVEKNLGDIKDDQRVVLDTEGDSKSSRGGSPGSDTDDGELIEVEKLSFEVEEAENNAELDIKTVESPEKLNLSTENDEIYEATRVSTEIDTANATLVYEVEKEFLSRNNASKDEIVVTRWKNGTKIQELPTAPVNESSTQVFVKTYSPKGFSVFTLGLEQATIEEPTGNSDKVLALPKIPVTDAFKLLLILSSLYLIRKPLIVYLSTLDIRVKYLVENARYRLLKYYRRIIWRRKSDVGVEELELTEDVISLEDQKEALKFRKNKLEKEVERKKELRDRYRRSLSLLSEKVEKWEEKL